MGKSRAEAEASLASLTAAEIAMLEMTNSYMVDTLKYNEKVVLTTKDAYM